VFRTTNPQTLPISGTGSAGMEAAFVKFIENYHANFFQGIVMVNHPVKDSLGQYFYLGLLGNPMVKPYPIADGCPHLLSQSSGHPMGYVYRSQSSGLKHQYLFAL
jgi:hypothetical protein